MGTYRDDLGAAVARADALQRRVDELEGVEERLRLAHAEIRELRKRVPGQVRAERPRTSPFPLVVMATSLLCLGALGIMWLGGSAPPPRASGGAVYAEFERPKLASVSLTSQPPGAAVWIDGERVGTTPVVTQAKIGPRRIVFRLDEETRRVDLDVIDGEQVDVRFEGR